MLVCVGTQCVPGVATRVVAKIYRPLFRELLRAQMKRDVPCFHPQEAAVSRNAHGLAQSDEARRRRRSSPLA